LTHEGPLQKPAFLTLWSTGGLAGAGLPRIYTCGLIVADVVEQRPSDTIATVFVALSGGRVAVRCLVRVRPRRS
jgi:hypothetical protein